LVSGLKGSGDPLYRFCIPVYGLQMSIHLGRSFRPYAISPLKPSPDKEDDNRQKNRRWNIVCRNLHWKRRGDTRPLL
jgi:hypothetical protein